MLGAFLKSRQHRRAQAMVESMLSLVVVLLVFLLLFNLADNTRAKLLAETAAAKCARARAVGYNDFQLRKIARLALMPASGKCLVENGSRNLSYGERINRIGPYLNSEYETQAAAILDFDGWRNQGIRVDASRDPLLTASEVTKLQPRLLDPPGADNGSNRAEITGSGRCETHYTDYLQ
jgi:hypothetical protein